MLTFSKRSLKFSFIIWRSILISTAFLTSLPKVYSLLRDIVSKSLSFNDLAGWFFFFPIFEIFLRYILLPHLFTLYSFIASSSITILCYEAFLSLSGVCLPRTSMGLIPITLSVNSLILKGT